jgi:2-polyprenyl-6-hydroxyphenyl methylase/3-demethylubiquinone-9 3-methyltransferase
MSKNVDQAELNKFADLAAHWWDEESAVKPLHQLNPLRVDYICRKAVVAKQNILDIGCGGGILSESLAKLGAHVTGIDLNKPLLDVAKLHQLESKTNVSYRHIAAESLAQEQAGFFDVVCCLEMLEHVPDPKAIIAASATLLKPGGKVFFSTLNRNVKSYLYAILGAEYILKLLPKHTHDYGKFIRPSELSQWCREVQLMPQDMVGISYHPLRKHYYLSQDIQVNYLLYAIKT